MRLRARILTIGTAAALTAAAASGCGAEDKAKDAAAGAKAAIDPVAQAATATEGQDGGIAMTMSGGITAAGQHVPLDGKGVVDRDGRKGTFTIKTQIDGRSVTMDEVIDGKVVYLKSELFRSLPGGKTWLKVDLNAEAAKQGLDLGALGGGTTQDPAQALEYLKGAGTSRKVGSATVNGTPTTQYHVDVDLRKVAAKSNDPDARATVDKLIKMTGTPTIPVEVWVDGKHLVRREQMKYDMTVGGQRASLDMTIDLTRFGVEVDAQPPADDQVLDLADLMGAQGGAAGTKTS
jgi:hypothetical protein